MAKKRKVLTVNCSTGEREYRDMTTEELAAIDAPEMVARRVARETAKQAMAARKAALQARVHKLATTGEVPAADVLDAMRAMAELSGIQLEETKET